MRYEIGIKPQFPDIQSHLTGGESWIYDAPQGISFTHTVGTFPAGGDTRFGLQGDKLHFHQSFTTPRSISFSCIEIFTFYLLNVRNETLLQSFPQWIGNWKNLHGRCQPNPVGFKWIFPVKIYFWLWKTRLVQRYMCLHIKGSKLLVLVAACSGSLPSWTESFFLNDMISFAPSIHLHFLFKFTWIQANSLARHSYETVLLLSGCMLWIWFWN